jgi:hypothetical protein
VTAFYASQGAPLPYLPRLAVVPGAVLLAQTSHAISIHAEPDAQTLGLCITEQRSVSLGPFIVSQSVAVTAVAVRCLLPRLQMGRVMAHELCHAHIALSRPPGSPKLPAKLEEGLCELWSLLWLESELSGDCSAEDAQLGAFLADSVRSSPSVIYGDGAREALAAWQRHGMRALMTHALSHGCLPW